MVPQNGDGVSGGAKPVSQLRRRQSGGAVRVALAEDNFLAREGITAVLEEIDGIELVASCGDLETLRDAIERTAPDVVVTEIGLPPGYGDEGIRLAAELRTTHPRVGVVVLGQHVEPLHATALFALGSHRRAYLLKDRFKDSEELARAIREVAGGGAVVDSRIVDELLSGLRRERSPLGALTARELEIVGLIAEGHSNSAIAERLEITKRGVERHISSIFAKLDLGETEDVNRRVKTALLFLARDGSLAANERS